MVRILLFLNGFAMGGVEVYLSNVIEHICMDNLQVDIFTPYEIESAPMALRLEQDGCHIYTQKLGHDIFGKLRIGPMLYRFLKERNYDVVHINTGHISAQASALMAAKLAGVQMCISHSHSTGINGNLLKELMRTALRGIIARNATALVACSKAAAKWIFGERPANGAIIAKNGIDTKKFAFHLEVRADYRKNLGLKDCFVIGHVGRFAAVKNHRFLIETFNQIVKREPSAKLLLIGDGELEGEIHALIGQYELTENVLFTGASDAVADYMCAMDVFVLPSLYEGLGIVLIEAQASGLPCIASDVVPDEVNLTKGVEFISLSAGADVWAERILRYSGQSSLNREDTWARIRDAGYDISDTAQIVQELYYRGGQRGNDA